MRAAVFLCLELIDLAGGLAVRLSRTTLVPRRCARHLGQAVKELRLARACLARSRTRR